MRMHMHTHIVSEHHMVCVCVHVCLMLHVMRVLHGSLFGHTQSALALALQMRNSCHELVCVLLWHIHIYVYLYCYGTVTMHMHMHTHIVSEHDVAYNTM